MEVCERAILAIEQQQKGIENTAVWMVGEQLKDICRQEPKNAELLAQDLLVPELSLAAAEKKIKAWADKQKRTGNCVCVPPNVAEEILRTFYGLGKSGARGAEERPAAPPTARRDSGKLLDLADFL